MCKKYAAYRVRKNENKTRNKRFVNLKQAKSVHILMGANALTPMETEQFYKQVYAVADMFQSMLCKLYITVCVHKIPLESKRMGVDVFDSKQVKTFSKKPKQPIVTAFNDKKSDILINLTPFVCYPLEHLAALSDAPLKVALKVENRPFQYDLQLQVDDIAQEATKNLSALIFYLEKIQPK
ncbi:MAG: hypothetical protein UFP03_03505 [Paludibacteraceae bacterium]|nr:hypothetical protein [Paludibacteraceae bacterium]